ncbi:MAG: DUF3604 domain-containing protein [Myxococcota bacterium]|nr:DUF3604 domain-containing protein [Myxococcota bacterium]
MGLESRGLRWGLWGVGAISLLGLALWSLGHGAFGQHEGPGRVTRIPLPPAQVEEWARERRAASAGSASTDKAILFGDLHVHTTFSADAFVMSLPLVSGEGAHPPADACDFARHCAALDFWSINDHAESLTPAHWSETVASIRQCNAVTTESDPDITAFLGWEWTQDGTTPENHWGHKNILLKGIRDEDIPTRPIAAPYPDGGDIVTLAPSARAGLALVMRDRRTLDFTRFLEDSASVPRCPDADDPRQLPATCREVARTPADLFERLDAWGVESIVIPHGTAWGNTAPPGAKWDNQIGGPNDDPERQSLVEIYSGHGNSEEWRNFSGVILDAVGTASCPAPQPGPSGFLPNCWRAGEIIRERCLAEESNPSECDARAAQARSHHAAAGKTGFRTVPGAQLEDWQDAGQCRDCFLPAFDYRPGMSAQYMLTRTNFDLAQPRAARLGFIASSDNHTGRPGTGFKELNRSEMTESQGPREGAPDLLGTAVTPIAHSIPLSDQALNSFATRDVERMSSFFTTGGLVAVHARGRDREAIWQSLQQREVYGTSGDRILLWFDLINPPAGPPGDGSPLPMGSEIVLNEAPHFRVNAVGARFQEAGCPEFTRDALGAERLAALCRNECYAPTDHRKLISRIEVIRLRAQSRPDEDLAELIEDPWLSLPCPPDEAGCTVEFTDPDYPAGGRDTAYYVRAIQQSSPAINGGNLRCEYEGGRCVSLKPCHGSSARTPYEEDCLEVIEERAWSSPIWVDQRDHAQLAGPKGTP